jgi:hypothetical protein
MATLSGNITATQRSIRVSDGAAVTPGLRVRVDDELIDFIRFEPYPYINGVRQKGLDATRWVVTRGVGDSMPASHLAGATLTAAVQASVSSETLAPPDPFADAGGEQTVRLLGPFTITFATDLENVSGAASPPHHELSDLAAGVVVVRAVALTRVPWVLASGATAIVLAVAITDPDDGLQAAQLYADRVDENWVSGSYAWGTTVQTVEDADTASTVGYGFTLMASSGTGAKLVCYRNDPSGAATAGETDIYIFIAESA